MSGDSDRKLTPDDELLKALRDAEEAVDRSAEPPSEEGAGGEDARLPVDPELARAAAEAEAALEGGAAAEAGAGEGGDAADELERARDRMLRLQADFENFRRRALKEREESFRFGHQNLVKALLPTVDNLERAIDHARQSGGADLEGFLQGVELVLRELLGVLARHGVTEIEALGKPFDPSVHEAMAQSPDDSVPPNTVIQVFEKGYRLYDRLLRPARVVVSQAGTPTQS